MSKHLRMTQLRQRRSAAAMRKKATNPKAALKALRVSETLTGGEAATIALAARMSWERLCNGTGTVTDYNDIAWAVNLVGLGLEHLSIPGVAEVVEGATAAMRGVLERYQRINRFGVDAQSLRDVPPLLDLHDQLLTFLSAAQLHRLLTEIETRRNATGAHIPENP